MPYPKTTLNRNKIPQFQGIFMWLCLCNFWRKLAVLLSPVLVSCERDPSVCQDLPLSSSASCPCFDCWVHILLSCSGDITETRQKKKKKISPTNERSCLGTVERKCVRLVRSVLCRWSALMFTGATLFLRLHSFIHAQHRIRSLFPHF